MNELSPMKKYSKIKTSNFRHVYSSPINSVPALGKTAIKDVATIRQIEIRQERSRRLEKFRFYQRQLISCFLKIGLIEDKSTETK